jgi:NADPH:quinone reductase-like Zn-dependent oxidoreductase
MSLMRAIVCHAYGTPDVLELENVEAPAIDDDRVLIRVHAASVNPLDWHHLTGTPYLARLAFGARRPNRPILGVDVAGTVEAVGRSITQFRPGDEVFGLVEGSLAEYASAREDLIVAKPKQVSFAQAAATPVAGLTALQGLRDKGNLQAGQQVLINGAAGGVGTFAVQIAKTFGANVTGVCSTANVDLVRSIGADHVVDYNRQDFARSDQRDHVLLDNVGNRSLSDCRRVLRAHGVYVMVSGPKSGLMLGFITRMLGVMVVFRAAGQKGALMLTRPNKPDLSALSELLATGKVTPAIDRTYDLTDTREAFRHLERWHSRGKIVVTI